MSSKLRRGRVLSALAIGLVLSTAIVGSADARRGGSFGSRGMRTYSSPAPTMTAPRSVGPVQRTMTPPGAAPYQPGFQRPGYAGAPGYAGYRPQGGFMNRWGGPIMGGLLGAGLMGMLMGHGFGGLGGGFGFGGGMLALLVQIGLIALVAMFAMRLFRRGGQGAYAQSPMGGQPLGGRPDPYGMGGPQASFFQGPPAYQPPPPQGHPQWTGDEVGLSQADFDAFERLLADVQSAFGREDYAALREHTTPEVMSYLAEELGQNAAAGRRNEVRDIHLISGDLSEAWSEEGRDYATVALRYSGVDLMRDRTSGQVVEGVEAPTETTEVWTFVRERASPWGGGTWKLSAIQDASR